MDCNSRNGSYLPLLAMLLATATLIKGEVCGDLFPKVFGNNQVSPPEVTRI